MNHLLIRECPFGRNSVFAKVVRDQLVTGSALVLVLLLVLAPLAATAGAGTGLNEQLMEAVELGDLARVKKLLAKGADVNAESDSTMPQTPLMQASWAGQEAIVKVLLENGADVNAKTKDGRTALMSASSTGFAKIAKMLLDKGADVNAQTEGGGTALLFAAGECCPEIARMLLDKGAEVNAQAKRGNTALIAAAKTECPNVVKMLLDKGADVHAKTKNGMTALREAEIRNSREIVQLLKRTGTVNGTPAKDQETSTVPKNKELSEEHSTPYPDSPEGVVKAFINEALKGDAPVTVGEMRSCDEILLVQDKYFLKGREIPLSSEGEDLEQGPPNIPTRFDIATDYEIKKVDTHKNRSTVTVLYHRLGWIWNWPLDKSDCHPTPVTDDKSTTNLPAPLKPTSGMIGKETTERIDDQKCHFLNISNDTQEVTYSLARPANYWRILDSDTRYISVSSAFKRLQCQMNKKPGTASSPVAPPLETDEQNIEIKQNIETLIHYLNK
jgi:hypothetical protein